MVPVVSDLGLVQVQVLGCSTAHMQACRCLEGQRVA